MRSWGSILLVILLTACAADPLERMKVVTKSEMEVHCAICAMTRGSECLYAERGRSTVAACIHLQEF